MKSFLILSFFNSFGLKELVLIKHIAVAILMKEREKIKLVYFITESIKLSNFDKQTFKLSNSPVKV